MARSSPATSLRWWGPDFLLAGPFFKLFGVTFAATVYACSLLPGYGVSDVFPVAQDMQTIPDSSLRPVSRYLFRHAMAVDQPSRG